MPARASTERVEGEIVSGNMVLITLGEKLQSLERRRRGLIERLTEILHRFVGLTELTSQPVSQNAQGMDDLIPAHDVLSSFSQGLPGLAVDSFQVDTEVIAFIRNRACYHRPAVGTQTNSTRGLWCYLCVLGKIKHLQRSADLVRRQNIEEGRLLKLNPQSSVQSIIEDRIAGSIADGYIAACCRLSAGCAEPSPVLHPSGLYRGRTNICG